MPPLVTVIIPTYNRGRLLRCAIQSVLRQTLTDFELLVVGDGCTDDSGKVVASFDDPRAQWHNLPVNSGHQSAPNNYGLEHARGRYVAYLGHDDLWYPSHLEHLARALDTQDADLAHALCVQIGWNGVRVLSGVPTAAYLQPEQAFVPPCAVMHTLALVSRVGFWRDYRTLDAAPDREFFGRVRAAGARIVAVPELTAFKFTAAWRPDSYREDFSSEQADTLKRMQEQPDFLYRELIAIAQAYVLGSTHPPAEKTVLHGAKRYGWRIENARRIRGLDARPLPRPTPRQVFAHIKGVIRRGIKAARFHVRLGRFGDF